MGKKFTLTCSLIFILSAGLLSREVFELRALLWWTPDREIILAIDYYTTRADILMQIDWKKIKEDKIILQHDLIFLVGFKRVRLPLKSYFRKTHQGIFKIGTIKNLKKEEILLQNGIQYNRETRNSSSQDSPYKKFGLPGF